MASIAHAAIHAGATSSYVYNGDGVRTSKTSGGTTTQFTWSVRRSLPVILDDGTNQYTYGLGLIGMIAPGGVISYFLPDGLGSTANVTDASGTVTATYCYDVFGSTTMRPSCNSGASTNPFLFTGEQKDNESGYSYLRARYYDPATGRFVSRDPLGGGYKYAGNNPVNGTDPSGLLDVDLSSPGMFYVGEASQTYVIVDGEGGVTMMGFDGNHTTGVIGSTDVDMGDSAEVSTVQSLIGNAPLDHNTAALIVAVELATGDIAVQDNGDGTADLVFPHDQQRLAAAYGAATGLSVTEGNSWHLRLPRINTSSVTNLIDSLNILGLPRSVEISKNDIGCAATFIGGGLLIYGFPPSDLAGVAVLGTNIILVGIGVWTSCPV